MATGRDGTKKAKPAPRRSPAQAKSPSARAAPKGARKPAAKPAAKTAAQPVSKPAAKPAAKSPAKSAAKPAAQPVAKTPAKPAAPPTRGTRPSAPLPLAAVTLKPLPKVEAPPKFRREYRKWLERLISLRRQLVADGERLGEEGLKAQEQEVSVDHMADFGSDSYEQDTTLALIENKSEALRDVDEAIRRIEAKTYGLCEECEQLLPHGRLEVLPHARYCVKCQSAREGSV